MATNMKKIFAVRWVIHGTLQRTPSQSILRLILLWNKYFHGLFQNIYSKKYILQKVEIQEVVTWT